MNVFTFGHSSFGQPIMGFEFSQNAQAPEVLVLGGVHGDEYEGVVAAEGLLATLGEKMDFKLNLTIVPRLNPDGVMFRTRGNGKGVDLNRNLPTKDWSPEAKTPRYFPGPTPGSEPENQALMRYIDAKKPRLILSLHSWNPVLNINGDCRAEAETIAKHTGYKIDDDIGYPTPGCLGTYAGLERSSPTLTYEIQRGQEVPDILKVHLPALLAALKTAEERLK